VIAVPVAFAATNSASVQRCRSARAVAELVITAATIQPLPKTGDQASGRREPSRTVMHDERQRVSIDPDDNVAFAHGVRELHNVTANDVTTRRWSRALPVAAFESRSAP